MTRWNKNLASLLAGLLLSASFIAPLQANAEDLDKESQEALQKTQELLRNVKELEKSGLKDPSSKDAHNKAKSLMGNQEDTQALYNLSADIFETLVKDTGGDPQKMQEVLQNALKNPSAFAAKLSPDQLRRLKELAAKVEANRKTSSPR